MSYSQKSQEECGFRIPWFFRIMLFEVVNFLLAPQFFPESTKEYFWALTTGYQMWQGQQLLFVYSPPSAALEHQATWDFAVYIALSQLAVFFLAVFAGPKGFWLLTNAFNFLFRKRK